MNVSTQPHPTRHCDRKEIHNEHTDIDSEGTFHCPGLYALEPYLTVDDMFEAAEEISSLADHCTYATTTQLLRQAASSLRWQARWDRRHGR